MGGLPRRLESGADRNMRWTMQPPGQTHSDDDDGAPFWSLAELRMMDQTFCTAMKAADDGHAYAAPFSCMSLA